MEFVIGSVEDRASMSVPSSGRPRRSVRLGRRPDPLGVRYGFDDAIRAATWARELTPSLLRMLRTWLSTVCTEMNRRAPISLLLRPSATNRATSASRDREQRHRRRHRPEPPRHAGRLVDREPYCSIPTQVPPTLNSVANLDAPRAAIADSSASRIIGTRNGITRLPAPALMVSAAPSSCAESRAFPILAA